MQKSCESLLTRGFQLLQQLTRSGLVRNKITVKEIQTLMEIMMKQNRDLILTALITFDQLARGAQTTKIKLKEADMEKVFEDWKNKNSTDSMVIESIETCISNLNIEAENSAEDISDPDTDLKLDANLDLESALNFLQGHDLDDSSSPSPNLTMSVLGFSGLDNVSPNGDFASLDLSTLDSIAFQNQSAPKSNLSSQQIADSLDDMLSMFGPPPPVPQKQQTSPAKPQNVFSLNHNLDELNRSSINADIDYDQTAYLDQALESLDFALSQDLNKSSLSQQKPPSTKKIQQEADDQIDLNLDDLMSSLSMSQLGGSEERVVEVVAKPVAQFDDLFQSSIGGGSFNDDLPQVAPTGSRSRVNPRSAGTEKAGNHEKENAELKSLQEKVEGLQSENLSLKSQLSISEKSALLASEWESEKKDLNAKYLRNFGELKVTKMTLEESDEKIAKLNAEILKKEEMIREQRELLQKNTGIRFYNGLVILETTCNDERRRGASTATIKCKKS